MRPPREDRHRGITRTLWVVLLLNVLVAATKLGVGFWIGALALVADGLHSVLDASSNVVGLVGIALASRPPDARHPYGHHRFETLAALGIGLLIGASAIGILQEIASGLVGARKLPDVGWASALAVLATVVVNLFISRYEARRAKELRSTILEADSEHTKSDALAALAVLIGFGGSALGLGFADPLAALIVAGFIAHTAWAILRANLGVLADQARLSPPEVHRVASAVAGVRGAHKIRSRGSADAVQLDLHIHLDPELSLVEAHRTTHDVIAALREAFPEVIDVLIHTEPADGRERDVSSLAPGAR